MAADRCPQHDSDSHPVSSHRAGFRPALCVKSWSNLNGKAGRKLPWVTSLRGTAAFPSAVQEEYACGFT